VSSDATPQRPSGSSVLALESAPELVMRWLIPLRFLMGAGEAATLAIAALWLELPLPYAALWWVPALTLATNAALLWVARRGSPPARLAVPAALLVDAALFSFLLQKSGGPDNPFSALYAVPVAMAAMTGSVRATWAVAAVSAAGYALVFRWHEAQHFWHAPFAGTSVGLHAVGMWLAVVVVSVAITFFIGRITRTLREREAEISRLGELAARNARLASLTTLAAGAAHELSSPLGTIAVVARELERNAQGAAGEALAEDARLLRAEVDRCRSILDRMLARSERAHGEGDELAAGDALAALGVAVDERPGERLVADLRLPDSTNLGPRADFVEMVAPLAQNAFDASPPGAPVHVELELKEGRLRVTVRDEGTGMDAETLARAGEPFFTTRAPGSGTGLGLFVVRLNAERLGGTLQLRSTPGSGTEAVVEWPILSTSEPPVDA
jgi:two-component system sensor histidine kinase RegB